MTPLDLDRLAVRIGTLEHQRTDDWMPGDDLEFRHALPMDRIKDPRRLPSPASVREASQALSMHKESTFTQEQYRNALQVCLRLEGLISRNRPNSTQRMMYDMRRGRPPGFRR